ncbi:hypothetical protein EV193_10638 [Herbihabitans rhizosphaerae]|uniref:Uncharacterized protein n=1 Tax=Herbihabitans rhizosphaerae TaxID=1872711 RepID=A0A4Q7KKR4_9PSEU|nr:hypothetical protein [Herbihabitans rhizosphaerae]RZS36804.1 hypothetical protein EV193_10638 [Herbihabitans rhizosphaerae]
MTTQPQLFAKGSQYWEMPGAGKLSLSHKRSRTMSPNVDGIFERAIQRGATAISKPEDVFSGDRIGVLRCPFGIRWCLARHDRDVPAEEIRAAAEQWVAEQS